MTVRIVSFDPFLLSVDTLELDAELAVFLCSVSPPTRARSRIPGRTVIVLVLVVVLAGDGSSPASFVSLSLSSTTAVLVAGVWFSLSTSGGGRVMVLS